MGGWMGFGVRNQDPLWRPFVVLDVCGSANESINNIPIPEHPSLSCLLFQFNFYGKQAQPCVSVGSFASTIPIHIQRSRSSLGTKLSGWRAHGILAANHFSSLLSSRDCHDCLIRLSGSRSSMSCGRFYQIARYQPNGNGWVECFEVSFTVAVILLASEV